MEKTVARSELSYQFDLLARLLEITRENPFKIRSYKFASGVIRRLQKSKLTDSDIHDLCNIKGIGKAITDKSLEFLETGKISRLEELRETMPPSILSLATETDLSSDLISMIWKDLDFTAPEQILRFIEDRKAELKISEKEFKKATELLTS